MGKDKKNKWLSRRTHLGSRTLKENSVKEEKEK
jgi:hypothetical protein